MKKTITLIISALFLVGIASATTISQEKITVNLQDQSVNVEINVDDLTTETFNYQTSHPVNNLKVNINGNQKQCEQENLAVGTSISCETNLTQNFTVKINYSTQGLINNQESVSTFRYSQSIYRPIQNYSFRALLPEGTGVVNPDKTTTKVITPENGQVGNSEGRRFYVDWNTKPTLGQSENFKIIYEPLNETPTNNTPLLKILAALTLITGISYFVYQRKNKVASTKRIEELTEDEKQVVEMLEKEEGSMLQKNIVDQSKYSKAKISGVVSNLVEKEVVSKEKEGRSNKVTLNKDFRS